MRSRFDQTVAVVGLVLVAGFTSMGCAGDGLPYAGERYSVEQIQDDDVFFVEKGEKVHAINVAFYYGPWLSGNEAYYQIVRRQSAASASNTGEPLWPSNGRPSSDLIERYDEELPFYRSEHGLGPIPFAVNGWIGAYLRPYLIGTQPCVVAFLDDKADMAAYREGRVTQLRPPLWPEGRIGFRNFHLLVTPKNINDRANVVLRFPDKLQRDRDGWVIDPKSTPMKAKVYRFAEPKTIGDLIDLLAAERLEAVATEWIEVDVDVPEKGFRLPNTARRIEPSLQPPFPQVGEDGVRVAFGN